MNTLLALIMLSTVTQGTQQTSETVSIRKATGLQSTAIAVLDTNVNTVAGTVNEQIVLLQDLRSQRGFQSGVLFKSQDNLHVILYTQWESLALLQAIKLRSEASQLRPYAVAYLAARGGGDTLTLTNPQSRAVLINVISTDPERIDQLFGFWVRGAESYWLRVPDVIGAALHRSEDNRTLINIAEWTSGDAWRNATEHAGANLAGSHGVGTSDPKLYDVVALETR
jgi:hypothetical protein